MLSLIPSSLLIILIHKAFVHENSSTQMNNRQQYKETADKIANNPQNQ